MINILDISKDRINIDAQKSRINIKNAIDIRFLQADSFKSNFLNYFIKSDLKLHLILL